MHLSRSRSTRRGIADMAGRLRRRWLRWRYRKLLAELPILPAPELPVAELSISPAPTAVAELLAEAEGIVRASGGEP